MNEKALRTNTGSEIPSWHFTMLRDAGRNAAIEAAIASCNIVGKTVVEIGTGAGLPAMLFAKYGAKKVFSCEKDERLADVAREVIRSNNLQDRIAVIAKSSRQAILDGDLPSAPDVIFTETLDCGIVGEGYEAIAEDIRHLAGSNSVVMPERVHQFGVLCSDTQAFEKTSVSTQCGLDLSGLNSIGRRPYLAVNKMLHNPESISATVLFREYDYLDPNALDAVEHRIIAHSSGLCHGMTSYFNAYFGKFVVTSRDLKSHWATAFHPLQEPIPVESGRHYCLRGEKTGLIELVSI
ncbi:MULTISPECIES: 50S ribosomal protein L11 methyltransferase [Sinorhizobium]|uniref:Ribonucleotide-diphosphate reductase subunit beta n=1 Tax=Sinorhizobium americanum TaxID=194963 RepID=A0A2S3YQH2_9HYPH|nr:MULTISPECIES: 50S ribosomal protein L11 methyltransferase [Sinorhizobium]PDT34695.1 ribonucleotide-diphosphate reductase subunit beta [Sinorhizobium sp. FG01]PDT49492.1 ribonucleotide-diphosphate reductase subunit beta [Sinorhizobium sp. NG07B]POH33327.1 ribonucleotide-diphosphate reductase subunit beta [Sinorhizobium americanum]POH33501.1 ribonucleotide-diphosphate reductase subunit beta [Sinorhizobium americanum]